MNMPTSPHPQGSRHTLDEFVLAVRKMFQEDEYLIPYAWAQRKFRKDNYSMQSQGLLEDMFYDTFGHYLNRKGHGAALERRSGKEPWDYRYQGATFSHKEAAKFLFTAVWQPGEGKGNKTPKHPSWTFEHNVVFSYFPTITRASLRWERDGAAGRARINQTTASLMTHAALRSATTSQQSKPAFILIGAVEGDFLSVRQVLSLDQWRNESLGSLKARIGEQPLASTSLWITQPTKALSASGFDWGRDFANVRFSFLERPFFSGVYVFPKSFLANVPMVSNNKAHFPKPDFIRQQMNKAVNDGHFISVPRWPDVFANTRPPNLYQQIRNEYDELFRARTSPQQTSGLLD